MNWYRLGTVGSAVIAGMFLGCQEEPKYIMPENPAPWHPGIQPQAMGPGGGGAPTPAPKKNDDEKKADDTAAEKGPGEDPNKTSENAGDDGGAPKNGEAAEQGGDEKAKEAAGQSGDEKSTEGGAAESTGSGETAPKEGGI